jgi:DNA-binding NarL/FixJ family response regulator
MATEAQPWDKALSRLGDFSYRSFANSRGRMVGPKSPPGLALPMVVYVDERSLSREGIGHWLDANLSGFEVRLAADPHEALDIAMGAGPVSLVLQHLGAARVGSPEVAAALTRLVSRLADVPVAVLADSEDIDEVRAALACGVRGYIPSGLAPAACVEALRLVCAGAVYAPVSVLLNRDAPPPAETPAETPAPRAVAAFSQRQREILDCLRRGMANKMIAHALHLSEATVKVHVRNIMKKLRATNRTQVVLMTLPMFEHRSTPPEE